MPLFLIKIANSLNAEEIFKTDSLLGTKISIERFSGSNTAPQCRNCYGFYHSSETCPLKPDAYTAQQNTPPQTAPSLKIRAKHAGTAMDHTSPTGEDAPGSQGKNTSNPKGNSSLS
ncbi:hypothetical protein CEXT_67811 [Caerostris extrusa]|uniref:Uncharacterized protein n=1 Tax=Caerostris extrusa TaxID=172846 RepID=A0AAV4NZI9_CAEEX|nr:hypothetical protein CEXT_67811 [Caerostris extrusa]